MIDGIDYYPRQKRKVNFKLWVASLLLVMIVSYVYFDNKQGLQKPKSTLIVISEPEIEQDFIMSLDYVWEVFGMIWQPFLLGCMVVSTVSAFVGYWAIQLIYRFKAYKRANR